MAQIIQIKHSPDLTIIHMNNLFKNYPLIVNRNKSGLTKHTHTHTHSRYPLKKTAPPTSQLQQGEEEEEEEAKFT